MDPTDVMASYRTRMPTQNPQMDVPAALVSVGEPFWWGSELGPQEAFYLGASRPGTLRGSRFWLDQKRLWKLRKWRLLWSELSSLARPSRQQQRSSSYGDIPFSEWVNDASTALARIGGIA